MEPSVLIALLAVLISLGSTYFSYKETNIMKQQQNASVWPYLQSIPIYSRTSDTIGEYKFTIRNKGVGPAIIKNVDYIFESKNIEAWALGKHLKVKFPNMKIVQNANSPLGHTVIGPGESHEVISVKFYRKKKDTTTIWKMLQGFKYHLEFCYYSVYGDSWRMTGVVSPIKSIDCNPVNIID